MGCGVRGSVEEVAVEVVEVLVVEFVFGILEMGGIEVCVYK